MSKSTGPPAAGPSITLKANFAHLHVHTEYSLLDGACRIEELVTRAVGLGFTSLAITDHGALYGVVPFYKTCRRYQVNPVIGCEVYVAPRSRFDRQGKADSNLGHLVLLAENAAGYRNLIGLVTDSHLEGFYYKPRIDRELLARYRDGLIGMSACLAGEIGELLLANREEEARRIASEYRDLFGPNSFFLELMELGIPEQARVNRALIRIAEQLGIGLVATNDVHYTKREHAQSHDVLLCVQTNATVDEPQRLRFASDQFYLKSAEEMTALFSERPDALRNTIEIAQRCSVELQFGKVVLPDFAVPPGHTPDSYLQEICLEALPRKYPGAPKTIQERLDYELKIIADKGLSTYMLITWDLYRFAHEQGILVGPGRGSAPGSIVLYLLGVTGIDPIRFGIPFERFVNPERISMPDVDCDFEDERRDEVIRYINEKYRSDHVAQIITFGSMGPRLSVRDVGRAMNIPIPEVDRIAKMIDGMRPIIESVRTNPDLAREYEVNTTVHRLIDTAMGIEGLARHASTHAAGVVISREPLKSVIPLQRSTEGEGLTTQFDMTSVADVGLLKMDILGLRTLSVIKHTLELIERRGEHVNLESIPYDDSITFELLSRGETAGVFQLESGGMRQVVMELKPDQLEDIIALVALYRPGPMAQIPNFIAGKHGDRKITYLHSSLEPILRDTYGVIVYQEQVMETARRLAGFSMASAESLLYAMRKKKHEEMAKVREEFLEGAMKKGVPRKTAEMIFSQMAEFAGYGFNKAHSVSYAINAYQTAYLKAHYPAEFMAAQLTSIMGDKDKVAAYVQECRRMGIEVLPPDINISDANFTVEDGKIRCGLAAVKHVSQNAVEAIIWEREIKGAFRDLYELCARIEPGKLNKLALESLARAGVLQSLGGSRAQLIAAADTALEYGTRAFRDRQAGQTSLFGTREDEPVYVPSPSLPQIPELPYNELLAMEKDRLGVYLSGHPVEAVEKKLKKITTATIAEVVEGIKQGDVIVGGIITSCRKRIARASGKMMALFTLEDLRGAIEITLLPEGYEKYSAFLEEQAIVLVRGRAETDDRWREEQESAQRYRLLAQAVAALNDQEAVLRLCNGNTARKSRPGNRKNSNGTAKSQLMSNYEEKDLSNERQQNSVRLHIRVSGDSQQKIGELRNVIEFFRGDTEVLLHVEVAEGERLLRLGREHLVVNDARFTTAVTNLLGEDAIWSE